MTTLAYRRAVGADFIHIKALNEKLLPDNYDWYIWWHVQHTGSTYVVTDFARIVGYIVATWNKWPLDNPYIFSLAVLPEFRRQGVGRRLVQCVWDDAKRTNHPLLLHCRASNTTAQSLYRSIGFAEVQRIPSHYPSVDGSGRDDGLLLRKND